MAVDLRVEEYTVGEVMTNCFFIVNVDTKEVLVVDPGAEGADLAARVKKSGYKPVAVLLTHGHFDHAGGVADFVSEYPVPVYAHEAERETMESPMMNLSGMWTRHGQKFSADIYVKEGDILELAGFRIRVIFTPGHTPGGCCYYFEGQKVLAAGDTLFHGSIGRTDFPGGSARTLIDGIKEKLYDLPGDTEVLPGHNNRTTIGYERQYNPFTR